MPFVKSLMAIAIILFLAEATPCDSQISIRERLRHRIESAGYPPSLYVGKDVIYSSAALPLFYERRAYDPAWVSDGKITPFVGELLNSIGSARSEGLRPEDYHRGRIEATVRRLESNTKPRLRLDTGLVVDLELLCTDAFLIYGSHLLSGRVNPQTIDAEWYANRREADLAGILQSAISQGSIGRALKTLLPPQAGYTRLRQALEVYRQLERDGGWDNIPAGSGMKVDSREERVPPLRKRLECTGDLRAAPQTDSLVFDSSLKAAVVVFQKRHGLKADGIVGPATLSALNVPVKERIIQIVTNLERWRWLPQDIGQRHLIVNIANFELDANQSDTTVLSMRVIVGKSYRRTPVFSDRITYLVLNPSWNVPDMIAAKDILLLVKADPNYLNKNDFELFSGWGADMAALDPAEVDWTNISAERFPYRLRQKPGPKNALGKIKFMFPNQFGVYLHDTPTRGLFTNEKRDFSSGCIRVENPLALAEFLLAGDQLWTKAYLESRLAAGNEQTIRLKEPVPVHILYWTAWVTPDSIVHFRDDIYGRDRSLADALSESPPGVE